VIDKQEIKKGTVRAARNLNRECTLPADKEKNFQWGRKLKESQKKRKRTYHPNVREWDTQRGGKRPPYVIKIN